MTAPPITLRCDACPHERHADRCWELVERDGMKVLCPCSEFYGYTDLDGLDVEHDEGLPAGPEGGLMGRSEWEKEKRERVTSG